MRDRPEGDSLIALSLEAAAAARVAKRLHHLAGGGKSLPSAMMY